MSQRTALARFLSDSVELSSAANRRTWRTVVVAGAMLGSTYVARPALAGPYAEPPIASSPTATTAAEVAAAIGRPLRVAQAGGAARKPAPPPGPPVPRPLTPPVTFDQPELDLGTVVAGSKKTVEFTFTNATTAPVTIDRKMITSSCACLVATPPKQAIPAGGKGLIKAVFTAPAKVGATSKALTIKFVGADKTRTSQVLAVTSIIQPAPRPRVQKVRATGRGFILS